MRYWILALASIFIFSSCKKDAGEGGSSKITGTIIKVEYNKYTSKIVRSYNANEEDVYINYGDNNYFGDRVRTDKSGNFEFNYLTKGKYTIYAYSDDTLNYDLKTTENVDAEVNSNNSTVTTPNITIIKIVDNGNASITGTLFAYDYDASLTILKDTFYVADEYVYIAIKGESTYLDRIKTFYDGSFVFSELLPGEYEVYAYSKANTASGMVAIKTDVEITDYNEAITLPRIEIIK